jgi:hypothetical protein
MALEREGGAHEANLKDWTCCWSGYLQERAITERNLEDEADQFIELGVPLIDFDVPQVLQICWRYPRFSASAKTFNTEELFGTFHL